MSARLLSTSLVVALLGAIAPVLIGTTVAPAPASAETPGPEKPLTKILDTMAPCPDASDLGVRAGGACVTAGGTVQLVAVDRQSLELIANEAITPGLSIQMEWNRYGPTALVVLSAPAGYPDASDTDRRFLAGLGVAPDRLGRPFSIVGVSACPACPVTVNDGYALEPGGQAGRMTGFLQRDDHNNYVYTSPDYVPFDTRVADSPDEIPVMRVGDETYQAAADGVVDGDAGFEVLVLSPADLRPIDLGGRPNPSLYVTNHARAAVQSELEALAAAVGHDDSLVLLQSFGLPSAASQAWNGFVAELDAAGATGPLLNSLNRPDLPGLHAPTGYAFAGYLGRAPVPTRFGAYGIEPESREAWQAPSGRPIALHGVLARQAHSLFAPLLADASQTIDESLTRIAYQPPTPFPFTSTADAAVIKAIQDQLAATVQFPQAHSLRDEYWAAIGDTRWDIYRAALAGMPNPDPANFPTFDAIRAQLLREFDAVITIRGVLVDSDGLAAPLRLAFADNGAVFTQVANAVEDALDAAQSPPVELSPWDVTLDVLTVVAGAGAVPDLPTGFGATSSAAVVLTGMLAFTRTLTESDSDGADFTGELQDAAVDIGARIAAEYTAAVNQFQRLAEIFVADYGKLTAIARDFTTNPAYTERNAQTATATKDVFEQAARQAMYRALLPSAMWKDTNNGGDPSALITTSGDPYPRQCLATPAGDEQAMVDHFVTARDGGGLATVQKSEYFYLKFQHLDDNDDIKPPAALLAAMYSPPNVPVQLGDQGQQPVLGAGLDPETFLYHLDLETPDPDLCTFLRNSGRRDNTSVPGQAVEPVQGGGQQVLGGRQLSDAFIARLTDSSGAPLSDSVTFGVPEGYGSFAGQPSATVTSRSDGWATSPLLTTSQQSVAFGVTASTGDPEAPAAVFDVVSDGPQHVQKVAGDALQARPGERFPAQLSVKVTDANNEPVSNRQVLFTVDTSSAYFYDQRPPRSVTRDAVYTDARGTAVAAPLRCAESSGPVEVVAVIPGQGGPDAGATFTLTCTTTPKQPIPGLTLTSSTNPSIVRDPVAFTAELTGLPTRAPTGTVQFTVDGAPLGGPIAVDPVTGRATTDAVRDLALGEHAITAAYSGDAAYAAKTAQLTQTVTRLTAQLSVTSPANASYVGQPIAFTAHLVGAARLSGVVPPVTGTVRFTVDGRALGSAVPVQDGTAVSASVDSLDPGWHDVAATYSGDDNYAAGTVMYTQTVAGKWATQVEIASSDNAAVIGEKITFTATVRPNAPATGTPTGNVRFLMNYAAMPGCDGLPLVNGSASCSWTSPDPTSVQIAVAYSGDSIDEVGQSDPLTQRVSRAGTSALLTVAPQPSVVGQGVTLSARVHVIPPGAGTPTGTITFLDGGSPILECGQSTVTSALNEATSRCDLVLSDVGTHHYSFRYSGDARFLPSAAAVVDHEVGRANTRITLTVDPTAVVVGQGVQLSASVAVVAPGSATPEGTITFADNGTPIAGCTNLPVVAGENSATASCAVVYQHIGSHDFGAGYSGDRRLLPSAATRVHLDVAPAQTTTALAIEPNPAVYGNAVSLAATVAAALPGSGTPTGEVRFIEGETVLGTGTLGADGIATLSVKLHGGSHSIVARYVGDGDYLAGASGATTLAVEPAATTLIAAKAVSVAGKYQLSARLTRTDDGSPIAGHPVAFSAGSTALCTAQTDADGVASCSAGSRSLAVLVNLGYVARFAGTIDYQASSSRGRL